MESQRHFDSGLGFKFLKWVSTDRSWEPQSCNIPSTLGSLQQLIELYLDHNTIEGTIPETFGGLVNLEGLDLSHNNISGVIPKSLEELKHLKSFDVSFNKLQGEIPNGGPIVDLPYQSFMSNQGLCGSPQMHVPACSADSYPHSKRRRVILIVVPSLVIVLLVSASAIAFMLIGHRRKTINTEDDWSSPEIAAERISYYELQRATRCFDVNNLIGSGSFGSVYKGTLTDGMIVAIKVFNVQLESTFQTFHKECEVLRNLRHRNLIKIIGSCCN